MGGSSSREVSRRGSKRRRKREEEQRSGQQEMLPTEREFSKHFDHPMGFYSHNSNYFDHQNRSNDSHLDKDCVNTFGVNLENLNNFHQRPNSTDDSYEERQFRRPIRRHHSFSENRFQFQNGQDTINGFRSSHIRCNSLTDLNDRGFLFEGQYIGNRFTNFSNCNFPVQNLHFDRTSPHNSSRYDNQSSVGHGGTKRYSYDGYNDDVSWGDSSYGACEEVLGYDSSIEPQVKRWQSDENENVDSLSGDNRSTNENERSHSGLSFYSNTASNSADSDMARAVSNEECGALDILTFPTEWSSYAVDKTGYVNISFLSPEGRSVKKYFERTCRSKDSFLSISGIIRIENPFLHTLYLLKKEEMAVRNGHVDELFLYHGTKKRNVTSICEDNLDWRQYSEMHRFGKGVSFSPSAMYSSHYSDERSREKTVMLFKVLVSKSTLGSPEMNIPPDEDGVSYDTSIKEDVSVVVKYCDNEFYPLYKIIYSKV